MPETSGEICGNVSCHHHRLLSDVHHYHLLLRQDGEISLSKFSNVVFNAYVQALNKQFGRRGTLFEGRFRHVLVDKDEYALQLCRYIHLNPVKAGLVSRPEDWIYSDYREWISGRKDRPEDSEFMLSYFAGSQEYQRFVMDYRIEETLQGYLLG
ncbi:MAG: transposase [Candidatus Latescibacterota bacterium]